ncbi:hypothetical protein [Algoriphagus boritolerans]|uniref:hypothetical protein n=1 Tax=Algoriphagus boritolerans TaxID=308111 RepID=UPI000AC81287
MILYIFPVRTAFIDRDLEMISPVAKIKPLEFTQSPVLLPFYFILQFFSVALVLACHLPIPLFFWRISQCFAGLVWADFR